MIIKILIIILVISICVLFGLDFYFYLTNRYCRYHIGRWNDIDSWKNSVRKKAISWLNRTPTVKITDNSRYVLLDMIDGKYRSKTIQSWQKGALILGLQNTDREKVNKEIKKLINDDGSFVTKPVAVDCGLLSYAILKNSDKDKVKKAMDYAVNLIMNNIGKDGMICYVNDKNSDERYVDTIGLVCPFLAYYGKVYSNDKYTEEAVNQLKLFSKYGLEKHSLLPNHAFSVKTKLPLGVYGWGRGAAWYVIGLIDTYLELSDSSDKTWLENHIRDIANSYMSFQRTDGGFGYILQLEYGYDSSTTATLAYFYRQCYKIFGLEEYNDVYRKCINKLMTVTRINGAIDWCQGDTKGIGTFAQTFDIMPFAQGFCLRSISEDD